jgi:hypothetical protein
MRQLSSLQRNIRCSHGPACRPNFDHRNGKRRTAPWLQVSTIYRFSLICLHNFWHPQPVMRLLVEILIIAALIYFGWNTPFKDHVAQANRTITTKLHGLGSKLQKHHDPSVRRY